MGRPKGSRDKKPQHKWSDEEKEYLAKITPNNHYKDIIKLMNEKFEYDFSEKQVTGAIKRYGLKTGFKGHFKKGFTPWNKGLKGYIGPNRTSFKKGHAPVNYRPVGSERVTVDGYIEIKVEDPNKWKLKHRVIYEKYHGEIPAGHTVIFADGDKMNVDIDNLLLVSRKQLLMLNRNNLISNDKDLTKTGLNIADIMIKLNELEKDKK